MIAHPSDPPAPIAEWVGKQMTGQALPTELLKRHIDQIKGQPPGLQGVMGKTGQPRIIVPRDQIKNLVLQTHNETLHQGHLRVYSILKTLYYWPNMPRDIAQICKACTLCKQNAVRRAHLSTKFETRKLENLPMPRQSYGIDFYGVPKGEILVIVDLCTRETTLAFMTSRNQDKVARALLSQIIFSRGVPTTLRSDSAPELVAGWVGDINAYLGINQVRTGGYNPRGNAVCERANQTIGAMLRKCSDTQYQRIKDYLPAMAFAMNSTYSSALNCTPFEAGHGLPARTIAQARADSSRIQFDAGGNDDVVQDVSKRFDTSQQKEILELATRLATAAHQEAEWHRRLTSQQLNMAGRATQRKDLSLGSQVWFYKPPDQNQVWTTGRKVKHLAHYHGPATITEKVGPTQYKMLYQGKRFQRDGGMLVPFAHMPDSFDISDDDVVRKPRLHHVSMPFREGEFILTKDDPNAPD